MISDGSWRISPATNGVDGGGHPKAAGARIPTCSNELFLDNLLEKVS